MSSPTPHEVTNRLYELTRSHGKAFVFVDRFVNGPLQDAVSASVASSAPSWFPLEDKMFEDEPEYSPALLGLDHGTSDHMSLLERSVALAFAEAESLGTARSLCGWVFFRGDTRRLTSALSRRLQSIDAEGLPIYLRYFDPRVLPRLMELLGDKVSSQLIAPATAWCLLDRNGEWTHYESDGNCKSSRLDFGKPQAGAVARVQLINRVALALRQQGLACGHDRDSHIDMALLKAVAMGLIEDDDQVSFAVFAMKEGRNFTGHGELPLWIERATQTALPFEEVVAHAWATYQQRLPA